MAVTDEMIEKYTEYMREIANSDDGWDDRHMNMDSLMCEILSILGFDELVNIFEDTDKWYA